LSPALCVDQTADGLYRPRRFLAVVHCGNAQFGFFGEDSVYCTRYSDKEKIDEVWLVYNNDIPVGCGAYRQKTLGVGEVKRMFIRLPYRGKGLSKILLSTIEEHAIKRGDKKLYLDTRITLEPAVSLYRSFGFLQISRNGLYIEMEKQL
jgi:GNAT superfamily N-acetyltransferase